VKRGIIERTAPLISTNNKIPAMILLIIASSI
jgi:hypothetical protein